MKRIYWNLRKGLAGGYFLAADNVDYVLMLYTTNLGNRCDILNAKDLTPVKTNVNIKYAKTVVRKLVFKGIL